MYKKSLFLLLAAVATLPFSIFAQAPKYSNDFLAIGVGAKALGMSGAQSSVVDDVTAGYWNPAGLSLVKANIQIAAMHNEYFAGIAKYDYVAIAAPIDATRTVGFSAIRFAVDDIIDSTNLLDKDGNVDYDRLRTFSASDYAFLFSYAQKMKIEGLRLGGNVKVIHRKAGDFAQAWGFGFDLGAQYDRKKWKFAAVGKDVTSTFNAWTYNTSSIEEVFNKTGNEIPQNGLEITLPRLILGMSYKTNITKKITFQPALDLDLTFDGKRNVPIKTNVLSIDPKVGFEFGYDDFIFLRTGIQNIQQVKNIDQSTSTTVQPNLGVGIKLSNISIDYALTNIGGGSESLYSNVFSLRFNINKLKKSGTVQN